MYTEVKFPQLYIKVYFVPRLDHFFFTYKTPCVWVECRFVPTDTLKYILAPVLTVADTQNEIFVVSLISFQPMH